MNPVLASLLAETTLFVLIAALLTFRGLGALGVRRFASWPVSAAHAMAVMLVMTASAHFMPDTGTAMPSHADMVAMVPPFVPWPSVMVVVTGVAELAAAVGLVVARTRWAAGMALIALLLALTPANVYAAVNDVALGGEPATPLVVRIPEQLLYLATAWWATRGAPRPRFGPALNRRPVATR